MRAREPVFSRTYGKPNAFKVGRNPIKITPIYYRAERISRYEQRKLISQARRWSVKNTTCMHTNTVKTLSTITTWHSQRSLEWCTYLGRFWGALPWKMKIIHSVLSSSDVGRKWRLLCSVLQLLECRENGGQLTTAEGETMAIQGSQSAYWDWLGLKGIKKLGVGGFLSL